MKCEKKLTQRYFRCNIQFIIKNWSSWCSSSFAVPQNKQLDSLPVLPTTPLEKTKTAHSKNQPTCPAQKMLYTALCEKKVNLLLISYMSMCHNSCLAWSLWKSVFNLLLWNNFLQHCKYLQPSYSYLLFVTVI